MSGKENCEDEGTPGWLEVHKREWGLSSTTIKIVKEKEPKERMKKTSKQNKTTTSKMTKQNKTTTNKMTKQNKTTTSKMTKQNKTTTSKMTKQNKTKTKVTDLFECLGGKEGSSDTNEQK